jgi:hypothetical protein
MRGKAGCRHRAFTVLESRRMGLIRSLFWLALFLAATFAFTVLFEHGPGNFATNAKQEFDNLEKLYNGKVDRKKDESDKIGR